MHFWSNFDPLFPPEDGWNKKKIKNFQRKPLAIELSKYGKIKAQSCLLFLGKIGLLFLARNRARSKVRGSKSNFDMSYFTHPFISWWSFCKIIMVPALSSFRLWVTKDISEKLQPEFSSLAVTSTFLKKIN